MIFLDANVLIRYLTGDDRRKANRCERLLRQAETGRITLFLTHLGIAEVVWVLSKKYRMPKPILAESIRRLLNTPHILCDEAPLILAALELFESRDVSFIDAYHAALLPARGITGIYSYDTDFDRLPGITRREP